MAGMCFPSSVSLGVVLRRWWEGESGTGEAKRELSNLSILGLRLTGNKCRVDILGVRGSVCVLVCVLRQNEVTGEGAWLEGKGRGEDWRVCGGSEGKLMCFYERTAQRNVLIQAEREAVLCTD